MDSQEKFTIDSDKKADWALKQIREAEAERDRLVELADAEIAELNQKKEKAVQRCDSDTAYIKTLLLQYFDKVPHKETQTQESYKLLNGTLIYKKPSQKITHNDEQLIKHISEEYVKVTKKIDWAGFKKNLQIQGDAVIDTTTGEIVEGCSVEESAPEFQIKTS